MENSLIMAWKLPSRMKLSYVLLTFLCAVLLLLYAFLTTFPENFTRFPILRNSVVVCDDGDSTAVSMDLLPKATSAHISFLPILDFTDLGINKTKLLLLIIVSTAPQRVARRHAIRDTWWKHCTGNQVFQQF